MNLLSLSLSLSHTHTHTHTHTQSHTHSHSMLWKRSHIFRLFCGFMTGWLKKERGGVKAFNLAKEKWYGTLRIKYGQVSFFFYIQIISFLEGKWKELKISFTFRFRNDFPVWIYAKKDDPLNVQSATEIRGCREKQKWSSDISILCKFQKNFIFKCS